MKKQKLSPQYLAARRQFGGQNVRVRPDGSVYVWARNPETGVLCWHNWADYYAAEQKH